MWNAVVSRAWKDKKEKEKEKTERGLSVDRSIKADDINGRLWTGLSLKELKAVYLLPH